MDNNSQLNPTVVKTALDKVVMPEFDKKEKPGYVDATSPLVFNQLTDDKSAVIEEVFAGSGMWEATAEQENYKEGQFSIDDRLTTVHTKYTKSIRISEEFIEDEQFNIVMKQAKNMGLNGRKSRDNDAFALYRNAFTTNLTAAGTSLISDSHTTRSGDTVDNRITDALSETSLDTAIQRLYEMKAQDGVLAGTQPETLLIAPKNYKTAAIILDSMLRSGTDFNDANIYSTRYQITMACSRWLGTAAGGDDDNWFLIGDTHEINRYERVPMTTMVVPGMYQSNGDTIYKGRFRQSASSPDFIGIVGAIPA